MERMFASTNGLSATCPVVRPTPSSSPVGCATQPNKSWGCPRCRSSSSKAPPETLHAAGGRPPGRDGKTGRPRELGGCVTSPKWGILPRAQVDQNNYRAVPEPDDLPCDPD